jgi:hypothetical protein
MRQLLFIGLVAGAGFAIGCGDDSDDRPGPLPRHSGGDSSGGDSSGGEGGNGSSEASSAGEGGRGGNGEAGSGDPEGGAGGAPTASSDVTGHVYAARIPRPDIAVIVNGFATATDDSGRFSVPNVADEYQVIVVDAAKKLALVVDGLRSRSPRLQFGGGDAPARSASIGGALSGGAGFPNLANQKARAFFVGDATAVHASAELVEGDAEYSVDPSWASSETMNGTLMGLQWSYDESGPLDYLGFAKKAFTAADGVIYTSSSETDLALASVLERDLVGDIDAGDYSVDFGTVRIGPADLRFTPGPDAYVVPVPIGVSVPVILSVNASTEEHYAGVEKRVPATGAVNLTLPEPPLQLLPVADATGVDYDTTFTWSSPEPEMVARLQFLLDEWVVTVVTSEKSVQIPVLSDYGLALPEVAAASWKLATVGPADSADEALDLEHAIQYNVYGTLEDYKSAEVIASRPFTTAD